MMLDSQADALTFPRGDLALGFCRKCAFVSNVLFDRSLQDYSAGYEEQQSFSPRFREFQSQLIARLIERYDLRRKAVVEIGCGKGDFLLELCEVGDNCGVGIDPTCDPARMEGRADGRVRFIAEYYGDTHADLPCDFLCCRHTLEHIHPTHEFVRRMREVVGTRSETLVFFELPAVERVLSEKAFWDVYYEHCSYFSLGALARLFRANRFDIVELEADFSGQYLVITARPVGDPTEASLPAENDLERVADSVALFQHHITAAIEDWRSRIVGLRSQGKRIAVWGSGSKCVAFLCTIGMGDAVGDIVDVNPYRHGKWLAGVGKQVVAPAELRKRPPDVVIIMNPVYRDEIGSDLRSMGLEPELLCV
ncbi:MAG: class I SAM-dependent methyltransferase [Phycisphaerae bacterium]